MKLQVLQDNLGNEMGVYLPMEDWTLIKNNYPDIEIVGQDLPQGEKDLIDKRLNAIQINPKRLRPINEHFEEFNCKI